MYLKKFSFAYKMGARILEEILQIAESEGIKRQDFSIATVSNGGYNLNYRTMPNEKHFQLILYQTLLQDDASLKPEIDPLLKIDDTVHFIGDLYPVHLNLTYAKYGNMHGGARVTFQNREYEGAFVGHDLKLSDLGIENSQAKAISSGYRLEMPWQDFVRKMFKSYKS